MATPEPSRERPGEKRRKRVNYLEMHTGKVSPQPKVSPTNRNKISPQPKTISNEVNETEPNAKKPSLQKQSIENLEESVEDSKNNPIEKKNKKGVAKKKIVRKTSFEENALGSIEDPWPI